MHIYEQKAWDTLWVKYYLAAVHLQSFFFTGNKAVHVCFQLLPGYNNNFMYPTKYKVRGNMTDIL